MRFLYPIAIIVLIISFFANKTKTWQAIRLAWKKLSSILPRFLTMISILAVISLIFPVDKIGVILNQNSNWLGLMLALGIGSIIFVPGFIAYPLAAVLLENGVPYYIIAGFTTSLMLVGFASLPIEITYFGKKTAILRNISGLVISLLIAIAIGFIYGEF
ncbi:MAG: hypothetical protein P9M05_06750 [Candidatus Stygibacter australis]|nr:hypothetical protein [Candidatus Stygibacter australis]